MSATRARPELVATLLAGRRLISDRSTALAVLFFMSGFPALLYQLVWQRALFRILGVNVESVTIVVTAFMVGLGLGSLAGGRLSMRPRLKLLPLLAVIEAATALFGIVSLAVFEWIGNLALGLPMPVTAAITLALVLVPTLLMGATLPIMVGELARGVGNTGQSMGLLYFANTLGAAAACFAGLAVLFPFLGMGGSIAVAVAINLLVALGALVTHLRAPRGERVAPVADGSGRARAAGAARGGLGLAFPVVLALAALGGLVSLSYEILLFRLVSFVTGGSATAFAAVLGAFLVGIAMGSRDAGRLAERDPAAAPRQLLIALVVGAAAGFLLLPAVWLLAADNRLILIAALVATGLIARSWGMLLPYLTHVGIAADGEAGRRVSQLYLANIAGSGTGSIVTGFVLMQHLTLVSTAQLLLLAGLATTAVLWRAMPGRAGVSARLAGAVLAVSVGAALLLPTLTPRLLERMQLAGGPNAHLTFTRVIENRSGIVAVDETGTVWGHGKYDGRFNVDIAEDTNGVLRPYGLSLLHPSPRRVLMIGLASGSWARIIASNPHVEELTVVEINPAYVQLVGERPEVRSILADPKVRIVIDDGRRWLKLNPERQFDAVVSNTTWYYRANVTNLLSAEFLGLVERHLAPGGIFFYNTTMSPRAQRTACLASPHALRFTNHMVLARAPVAVDFARWRGVLEGYTIDGRRMLDGTRPEHRAVVATLMTMDGPRDAGLARPLEDCASILARTDGMAPFTDDNMGSEWRHPLGLH